MPAARDEGKGTAVLHADDVLDGLTRARIGETYEWYGPPGNRWGDPETPCTFRPGGDWRDWCMLGTHRGDHLDHHGREHPNDADATQVTEAARRDFAEADPDGVVPGSAVALEGRHLGDPSSAAAK